MIVLVLLYLPKVYTVHKNLTPIAQYGTIICSKLANKN